MIYLALMMVLALLFVLWLCIARFTNIFIASVITFLLIAAATFWAVKWNNSPEVPSSIYHKL